MIVIGIILLLCALITALYSSPEDFTNYSKYNPKYSYLWVVCFFAWEGMVCLLSGFFPATLLVLLALIPLIVHE